MNHRATLTALALLLLQPQASIAMALTKKQSNTSYLSNERNKAISVLDHDKTSSDKEICAATIKLQQILKDAPRAIASKTCAIITRLYYHLFDRQHSIETTNALTALGHKLIKSKIIDQRCTENYLRVLCMHARSLDEVLRRRRPSLCQSLAELEKITKNLDDAFIQTPLTSESKRIIITCAVKPIHIERLGELFNPEKKLSTDEIKQLLPIFSRVSQWTPRILWQDQAKPIAEFLRQWETEAACDESLQDELEDHIFFLEQNTHSS